MPCIVHLLLAVVVVAVTLRRWWSGVTAPRTPLACVDNVDNRKANRTALEPSDSKLFKCRILPIDFLQGITATSVEDLYEQLQVVLTAEDISWGSYFFVTDRPSFPSPQNGYF